MTFFLSLINKATNTAPVFSEANKNNLSTAYLQNSETSDTDWQMEFWGILINLSNKRNKIIKGHMTIPETNWNPIWIYWKMCLVALFFFFCVRGIH